MTPLVCVSPATMTVSDELSLMDAALNSDWRTVSHAMVPDSEPRFRRWSQ